MENSIEGAGPIDVDEGLSFLRELGMEHFAEIDFVVPSGELAGQVLKGREFVMRVCNGPAQQAMAGYMYLKEQNDPRCDVFRESLQTRILGCAVKPVGD